MGALDSKEGGGVQYSGGAGFLSFPGPPFPSSGRRLPPGSEVRGQKSGEFPDIRRK